MSKVNYFKSCLEAQHACAQLPTSAVKVTLLAFPAECHAAAYLPLGAQRPLLSIDISCRHGGQQQTGHGCGLMMGQTDGWMDTIQFTDPAQHYYASSVNKHFISTQETAITSPLLNSVSVAVGPAVP